MLLADIGDSVGCTTVEDFQKLRVNQCFTIYLWVVTASQPKRVQDMLGYQAVIIDDRMWYEGRGWLNYDRHFCKSAAADPQGSGLH